MIDSLAGMDLALNTFEFREVNDNIIYEILSNSKEDFEMFHFLVYVRPNLELNKTFQEKIDYYSIIINKALSLTKTRYAPIFFDLFLAFIMKFYARKELESLELIEQVVKNFEDKVEDLSDETWYMLYSLKYAILSNINYDKVFNSPEKIEEMKLFINDLKNNQEKYNNIEFTNR